MDMGFDKLAGLPVDDRSLSDEFPSVLETPKTESSDATTGASPGTAQACNDLGLNSLEANLAKFNIKPPGQV